MFNIRYEILWGIIIKYKNTSTRFATSRERFWVIRRTLRWMCSLEDDVSSFKVSKMDSFPHRYSINFIWKYLIKHKWALLNIVNCHFRVVGKSIPKPLESQFFIGNEETFEENTLSTLNNQTVQKGYFNILERYLEYYAETLS